VTGPAPTTVDLLRHGAEQGRFCEGCHAPGEMLAGRVTRHVAVPPADALTEGVSCIACHTATHADPVEGNGALTLAYDRAEAERDGPQGAALLAAFVLVLATGVAMALPAGAWIAGIVWFWPREVTQALSFLHLWGSWAAAGGFILHLGLRHWAWGQP